MNQPPLTTPAVMLLSKIVQSAPVPLLEVLDRPASLRALLQRGLVRETPAGLVPTDEGRTSMQLVRDGHAFATGADREATYGEREKDNALLRRVRDQIIHTNNQDDPALLQRMHRLMRNGAVTVNPVFGHLVLTELGHRWLNDKTAPAPAPMIAHDERVAPIPDKDLIRSAADKVWNDSLDPAERMEAARYLATATTSVLLPRLDAAKKLDRSRPPEGRNAVWSTADGRKVTPATMTEDHLKNAAMFALRKGSTGWAIEFAEELQRRQPNFPAADQWRTFSAPTVGRKEGGCVLASTANVLGLRLGQRFALGAFDPAATPTVHDLRVRMVRDTRTPVAGATKGLCVAYAEVFTAEHGWLSQPLEQFTRFALTVEMAKLDTNGEFFRLFLGGV
jgi:hypothetical protein